MLHRMVVFVGGPSCSLDGTARLACQTKHFLAQPEFLQRCAPDDNSEPRATFRQSCANRTPASQHEGYVLEQPEVGHDLGVLGTQVFVSRKHRRDIPALCLDCQSRIQVEPQLPRLHWLVCIFLVLVCDTCHLRKGFKCAHTVGQFFFKFTNRLAG